MHVHMHIHIHMHQVQSCAAIAAHAATPAHRPRVDVARWRLGRLLLQLLPLVSNKHLISPLQRQCQQPRQKKTSIASLQPVPRSHTFEPHLSPEVAVKGGDVEAESTIGNTGFRLGANRRTLQTDSSLSRLSKVSLFRRHLDIVRRIAAEVSTATPLDDARSFTSSAERMQCHSESAELQPCGQEERGTWKESQAGADADDDGEVRYIDAKRWDTAYVNAREALLSAFQKHNMGVWLVNDEPLQHFSCPASCC